MTDRAKGLLVHLDGDYHDKLNRDRIRRELADRLFDALGVGWTKTGGP